MRLPVSDQTTHELLTQQNALLTHQIELLKRQTWILKKLYREWKILVRPSKPHGPSHTLIGENHMADLLQYRIALDVLAQPHDVVSREMNVIVDGVDMGTQAIGGDGSEFPTLEVAQNGNVHLSFVDVDDTGNRSAALEYDFQAIDTFAPAPPAGLIVEVIGESHV